MKLANLSVKEQRKIRKSWSKKKKTHIETSKFVLNTAWKLAKDYAKKLNESPNLFFIWALRETWKSVTQPSLF